MKLTRYRSETLEDCIFTRIREACEEHRAQELMKAGDLLTAEHKKYGELTFVVLDFNREEIADTGEDTERRKNADHITLQLHTLALPEMEFDKNGSNNWETSTIRKFMNSTEFVEGFEDGFCELLTNVVKRTSKANGSGEYETEETFFLPSYEEVIGERRYALYKSEKTRVKETPDGITDWWCLRSANRGGAGGVWGVNSSGYVNYSSACSACRCAPACTIC